MAGLNKQSLSIPKTIKLFIGGEFPRTESGRSYPVKHKATKDVYANLCLASRKDLRASVTAAQEALKGWEGRSAFNRSQILYRMAEIMESRRGAFEEILESVFYGKGKNAGLTGGASSCDAAIDALVYYAGAADKYQQIVASVNPVNGPHHNFTTPEPVGIVAGVFDPKDSLGKIVADIAAVISSGNVLVALMPKDLGVFVAELGEVLATSDLPKGVVNLLSGSVEELVDHVGSHMEIQSLFYSGDSLDIKTRLKTLSVENMKRFTQTTQDTVSIDEILKFVEYKTIWHPVEY